MHVPACVLCIHTAILGRQNGLITGNEDSRGTFLSQWKKFYCATLLYGQNSGRKGISSVIKEVDEDGEGYGM